MDVLDVVGRPMVIALHNSKLQGSANAGIGRLFQNVQKFRWYLLYLPPRPSKPLGRHSNLLGLDLKVANVKDYTVDVMYCNHCKCFFCYALLCVIAEEIHLELETSTMVFPYRPPRSVPC